MTADRIGPDYDEMDARVQSYIRLAASRWRDTEQIGPFLATFTQSSNNPYLNYAIPRDAAAPSSLDVAALVSAFERRERTPRLEYLPRQAPAVEAALITAGFRVEGRLPLMICAPESVHALSPPPGIEILVPVADADFAGVVRVSKEAYEDGASPPTGGEIERRKRLLAEGGFAVLARDAQTGEPAGSGICDVPFEGVTELASVGVRGAFRRRGVAAALTSRLAREAFAGGVNLIWLTPLEDEGERIYSRVGFAATSEVLHISR
jgi:GNAT superfamily N-acetyltransferase